MAQLSDTPVQLAAALAIQIIDHARAGKPEEICGIIRGRGLVAYEVIPGQNIADERVENYTVDPQTLLQQFQFEETGEEMMGIYHSHPVSVAYPSATDAWNAYYPDSIYFICSLEFDDAPVIRAFRMITHFTELDLGTVVDDLPFYETRPGLFAYYQGVDQALPATLADVATGVGRPFYLVYAKENTTQSWQDVDVRLVELIEHPIASQ